MEALVIVFVTALLALFSSLTGKQPLVLSVVILGLLSAMGVVIHEWFYPVDLAYPGLRFGHFELSFSFIAVFVTFLIALLGTTQFTQDKSHTGDYFGLMLFSLCGAICLFGFTDMFMLFIGIEILSIPVYVLAGSRKNDLRSNEAALKYFLLGSFATGLLLFGIALIYGATGTFNTEEIWALVAGQQVSSIMFYTGIVFMACGLFFKIGAAPFHFWSPDVYTGSPTIVTSYMATVVKIAAFVALFKLFAIPFALNFKFWAPMFAIVSALTICIANITAVYQQNFKRMLAYSSISHAGYLMLALLSINTLTAFHLAFYLVSYSLATVCAFAIFMRVKQAAGDNEDFAVFNGLAHKQPVLAVILTICLLSMAGIPPTAGFFAKYYLFADAFGEYPWVVVVAILNSAISIFYYFRPVINMYFSEPGHIPAEKTSLPLAFKTAVWISVTGAALLGIASGWINVFNH